MGWLLCASRAPGTTRSRQNLTAKEVYFTSNGVKVPVGLLRGIQSESAEIFGKRGSRLVDTLGLRNKLSQVGQPRQCKGPHVLGSDD